MYLVSNAVHSVFLYSPCLVLLATPLRDRLRQFPNHDGTINVRGNYFAIEREHCVRQCLVRELLRSRRRNMTQVPLKPPGSRPELAAALVRETFLEANRAVRMNKRRPRWHPHLIAFVLPNNPQPEPVLNGHVAPVATATGNMPCSCSPPAPAKGGTSSKSVARQAWQ